MGWWLTLFSPFPDTACQIQVSRVQRPPWPAPQPMGRSQLGQVAEIQPESLAGAFWRQCLQPAPLTAGDKSCTQGLFVVTAKLCDYTCQRPQRKAERLSSPSGACVEEQKQQLSARASFSLPDLAYCLQPPHHSDSRRGPAETYPPMPQGWLKSLEASSLPVTSASLSSSDQPRLVVTSPVFDG